MCFPIAKLPHSISKVPAPNWYTKEGDPAVKQVLEQEGRNPLSVGKERPRAKK